MPKAEGETTTPSPSPLPLKGERGKEGRHPFRALKRPAKVLCPSGAEPEETSTVAYGAAVTREMKAARPSV